MMPAAFSPTARMMDLLRFIHGYQLAHGGVSPSFEEMAFAIGGRGKSRVREILLCLEERRLLRRPPHRHRAIVLLAPPAIPRSPAGEPLYFVAIEEASHG